MVADGLRAFHLAACVLLCGMPEPGPTPGGGRKEPPPPVERTHFSFEPVEPRGWTQTSDQVTVELAVIDAANYREHSQVWREISYVHKDTGRVEQLPWAACQFPLFRLSVENGSEQALYLGRPAGVVALLADPAGATLYPATREDLLDGKAPLWGMAAQMNGRDPEELARDLQRTDEQMAASLPLITDGSAVLPGEGGTFYACFFWEPWDGEAAGIQEWMRSHDELVLGLYDVPAARDETGAVPKKTRYEFKVRVAEWRWIYRYAWDPKTRTWWVQEPEEVRVR